MSKKILYLGNFFISPGHRGPSVELARKLQLRGYKILTSSNLKHPVLRALEMLINISFKSRLYEAAIVEVYSGKAFLWAEACTYALSFFKKKVVLILHGGNLPEFARGNVSRVRSVFSKAVRIVSPSLYLKEKLAEIEPHIQTIPNGLELSNYHTGVRKSAAPIFIWVRSFHEIYNPCLAVRVLAELTKDYPRAVLTFVGPDKGDGSLEKTRKLAVELGVESKINFHGPAAKSEIPALLEKADIFLNTSNIDNMPVSVIEAMACGLCVISTDAGGLRYLIENRREGLLTPVNDAAGMKEAADFLLTHPEFTEKISSNAAEKIKIFGWPRVISQWENLLESV